MSYSTKGSYEAVLKSIWKMAEDNKSYIPANVRWDSARDMLLSLRLMFMLENKERSDECQLLYDIAYHHMQSEVDSVVAA